MTGTATHGDLLDTPSTPSTQQQDAQLAALIRRLADLRPEIAIGWTPPPPPPAPVLRPPRFLPDPRFLHPLEPHPVTGQRPTRDDFPVPRDVVDSLARLRAIAAGTHRPGDHWPAHATPDYHARKRRPTLLQRGLRHIRWRRTAARAAAASPILLGAVALLLKLVTHD